MLIAIVIFVAMIMMTMGRSSVILMMMTMMVMIMMVMKKYLLKSECSGRPVTKLEREVLSVDWERYKVLTT